MSEPRATRLPGGLGTLDWSDWLYGLVSGFISGGASAVVSGVVVSFKDPQHYNLGTSDFYQLVGAVFLASGVLAAMNYLHTKPLPSVVQVERTVEKTEILPTDARPIPPPPTVVTTVKETTVTPANPGDNKKGNA